MNRMSITFDEAVWKVVANIKTGQVKSYGDVARAAGFPRNARMVSRALRSSPAPLPWHRVIRSDGTLAFEVDSEMYRRQRDLLEQEGIIFRNNKVDLTKAEASINLDVLLWGPPDSQDY